MYVLKPYFWQSNSFNAILVTIYKIEFMYTVHVFDLPVFIVCGTRKGRSKINEHFFISYICVTYFTKQHIYKTISALFQSKI